MSNRDATDVNRPALGAEDAGFSGSEMSLFRLLVVADDRAQTFALTQGTVLIGRADDADIRVGVQRLSRRHVCLHVGDPIRVEDLGSSNGTFLRGARLAPNQQVEVEIGETIDLAETVTLVVQQVVPSKKLHRLWPHGYFEARLEEECARAARAQGRFGVLRVAVPDDEASRRFAEGALAESLRTSDIVARFGPNEYEVLLIDADESRVRPVCQRLGTTLGRYGVQAQMGLALFPVQGRSAAALISAAETSAADGDTQPGLAPPLEPSTEGPMEKLNRLVERIARSPISIILQGETGVGKEVMARRIHALSERCRAPFVTVNCGALAETLLESELFGYERGAFTGATTAKSGLLEAAHGGTIFLDEVGEMPVSLQVKLLRVLEAREVLPVGGVRPRPIDVRVLAATNRNLEEHARRGVFRQDLFFRLNGIMLTIPPLRERIDEIEDLVRLFLRRACEQMGKTGPGDIMQEALDALRGYWWPGNIRELRNAIERAVVLSGDAVVRPEHLPLEKMAAPLGMLPGASAPAGPQGHARGAPPQGPFAVAGVGSTTVTATGSPSGDSPISAGESAGGAAEGEGSATGPVELKTEVRQLERERIKEALSQFGGNQTRAAKFLGISRGTLSSRMEEYGIPRPRKK